MNKYQYKIIFSAPVSFFSTQSEDLEATLNDPETYKDGWEFVQVLTYGHGTNYILLRRCKIEG